MRVLSLLICCSLLQLTNVAMAESTARISSLQWPAWLIRDQQRTALRVGDILQSGDQIETGSNAHAMIQMDEAITLQLGETTHFYLDRIQAPSLRTGSPVYEGSWRLVKGVFRYTTHAVGAVSNHDIKIYIGDMAIDLNGTDIIGQSDYAQDIVILLDGQITVVYDNNVQYMNKKKTYFSLPRDGRKLPVANIAPVVLDVFLAETEFDKDKISLHEDGSYKTYLQSSISVSKINEANVLYQNAGYPTRIAKHKVKGTLWHRIIVEGFQNEKDALRFANAMEGVLETKNAWIGK